MSQSGPYEFRQLGGPDLDAFHRLNDMFGTVFGMEEDYTGNRPSEAYINRILTNPTIIVLAAFASSNIVGGLVAYEFVKFEQERSEIYIYDLGVLAEHRRQGIASRLIEDVVAIAKDRGAYTVMVQADYGDDPAIALYTKLGRREDVLHFDIPV